MPKFADLGSDARIVTVNATKGSLAATPPLTTTFEGTTVTFAVSFASGYPQSNASFAVVAGLNLTDYTTTPVPGIAGTAGPLTETPKGAPTPANCKVVYTEPIGINLAADITVTSTGC